MKKILVIILILLFLTYQNNEKTVFVFNEEDEYSYFVLKFPDYNVSTNNLYLFDGLNIIWIKPFNLYKMTFPEFYFNNNSLSNNISRIMDKYLNLLEQKGYKHEIINSKLFGIKISEIKIYSKLSEIKKINIDNINYEKVN